MNKAQVWILKYISSSLSFITQEFWDHSIYFSQKMVEFFCMFWVVNTKTTGIGVLGNTHQVFGNVPNTWELFHWQDISIYLCINISMGYVLLGKLFIVLKLFFFIFKVGIAVFPNWSHKVVRCCENWVGLESQDACVLVPANSLLASWPWGSYFCGHSLSFFNCIPKGLDQIISPFLSNIDILCLESPMIPQGLKLFPRLLILREELGLEPRTF